MRFNLYNVVRSAITACSGRRRPARGSEELAVANQSAADAGLVRYSFHQRPAFQAHMRGQFDESKQALERLFSTIEQAHGTETATSRLRDLHDKMAKLNQQLDLTRCASEACWDKFMDELRSGHRDLTTGFQDTRLLAAPAAHPGP